MSTERLVREALENSVKDLACPEPKFEQLLAAGRAARRRRVAMVASLAAAAVLVLVLAGLSFAWAGRAGRALEPVPANPTTTATIGAPPSELHQWIDALPAGAPPASPYWHDGTLYVDGQHIPAPNKPQNIEVAGEEVLVTGGETPGALVRGDRLEPLPAPAGAQVGLSVDGRIAYWVVGTNAPRTKQFFTWDTQTKSALASRTVQGSQVELWGIDAAGNGYWQADANSGPFTRWDVRADKITATDLSYDEPWAAPEVFDGFVPWMHPEFAYRSPDGTKTVITDSVPRENPTQGVLGDWRLRVRRVGPDDSVAPEDVTTLAVSKEFPQDARFALGDGLVWWESNDSVLFTIDSDLRTYLLRCSANGDACQRVTDLGPWNTQTHPYTPNWENGAWQFARAPVSQ
ncbi:hypothetical protein GCM10023168_05320 [Fodinibacter luteus]|uniref:WD40 repeat protein n=1 Tax=Fodinibacter luteus TaxID=552064 RepID=A0ABP8K0P7_9MICO